MDSLEQLYSEIDGIAAMIKQKCYALGVPFYLTYYKEKEDEYATTLLTPYNVNKQFENDKISPLLALVQADSFKVVPKKTGTVVYDADDDFYLPGTDADENSDEFE